MDNPQNNPQNPPLINIILAQVAQIKCTLCQGLGHTASMCSARHPTDPTAISDSKTG